MIFVELEESFSQPRFRQPGLSRFCSTARGKPQGIDPGRRNSKNLFKIECFAVAIPTVKNRRFLPPPLTKGRLAPEANLVFTLLSGILLFQAVSLRQCSASSAPLEPAWRYGQAPLSKGSWIAEGKTEGIDTEIVTFPNEKKESLRRSIPSVTADGRFISIKLRRPSGFFAEGPRPVRGRKHRF